MPNHVRNKVKMTGIANLPLFTTKTDEYTKEQFTFFDFNKLIPMPESLNIESGSSEDVAIEAVLRKMSKRRFGFLSNKYGKMTDDEYERRKKAHGKTDEELAKIGLQYISNKVLYGHTTWYDWSCENWGTKWNSYDNEQVDADTILFSTAWSNPEPIMLKLSEMYPEAICDISEQIIKNGELQYKAMKHMDEYGYERQKAVPEMLEVHAGGANHK